MLPAEIGRQLLGLPIGQARQVLFRQRGRRVGVQIDAGGIFNAVGSQSFQRTGIKEELLAETEDNVRKTTAEAVGEGQFVVVVGVVFHKAEFDN